MNNALRWLLLSNCQAVGLGNCLGQLCPDVVVEAHSVTKLDQVLAEVTPRIDDYDTILIAPEFEARLPVDLLKDRDVVHIPTLFFDAYHPDLCYLNTAAGKTAKGVLSDYHSLIVWCGFQLALTTERTCAFFHGDTYEALGWFDLWPSARERLLTDLKSTLGTDMTGSFVRWGVREAFMYSVNHPHIRCLHDVARAILQRAGFEPNVVSVVPPDNLATSVGFPVYPELAELYGVPGSYTFKLFHQFRSISLPQLVAQSFAFYSSNPGISMRTKYRERADSVMAYMRENA